MEIERKAEGGLDLEALKYAHMRWVDGYIDVEALGKMFKAFPSLFAHLASPQAQTGGGGDEDTSGCDHEVALTGEDGPMKCVHCDRPQMIVDVGEFEAMKRALSLLPAGVEPGTGAGPDAALAMETMLVLACKELIRRNGNIESPAARNWWQGMEEGIEGGGPSGPKKALREPKTALKSADPLWEETTAKIIGEQAKQIIKLEWRVKELEGALRPAIEAPGKDRDGEGGV